MKKCTIFLCFVDREDIAASFFLYINVTELSSVLIVSTAPVSMGDVYMPTESDTKMISLLQ